jgi:hypothetical protein
MNGIEALAFSHRLSDQVTLPLFDDLADAPLATPFERGGNHAHWIVGHLTFSEGRIVHEQMLGEANPYADLEELFQGGTQPHPQGNGYPPYAALLARYRDARNATQALIESLSDEDLDRPAAVVPPGYEAFFSLKGHCLSISASHSLVHRGQLADIRRRLGRPKLLA